MSLILEIFKKIGSKDNQAIQTDIEYTPFERDVQKAFSDNRKAGHTALLVKLVPNEEGTMAMYDPAYECWTKCRYDFAGVPAGKNPYAEIEELDYEGEPVVMAFDLNQQSIPLQFNDWLAGTIHNPSLFIHKPAICLPPRESYMAKDELKSEMFKLGRQMLRDQAQELREQAKQNQPQIRLITVNGMHIS